MTSSAFLAALASAGTSPVTVLSPGASIGGVAIGAAGSGIYAGYVLSAGDEFTALDIASAQNPAGKYMTTRVYRKATSPGMRAPATGPLDVMHDVDPSYTGWQDSNRGVPIGFDSHSIVPGEGSGALRLHAIRQTAGEQALLNTGVAGQVERGAMVHTAGSLWYDSPAIIEFRARIPPGPNGQHPTLWSLSATPPGGPNFTGNEYGFEGTGADIQAYQLAWTNASASSNAVTLNQAYHDGVVFRTFTIVLSATDYRYFINGNQVFYAGVDPDDRGAKPDYVLLTNHVYDGTFMGQNYSASQWAAATSGVDMDIEWFRVWRPASSAHYTPLTTISDVATSVGATINISIPSQTTLWGATGLSEYVCAIANEIEEPGGTNTDGYGQFPAGLSYDSGTRTLSGTMPSKAGALNIAIGVFGDGNTCKPARFRLCNAPVWQGAALAFTVGAAANYDVYVGWDVGRLFQSGSNPKGLVVSGLPAGLSFSATTGRITGTPTTAGSGTVSLTCTNSFGQTVTVTPSYSVAASGGSTTLGALATNRMKFPTALVSTSDLVTSQITRVANQSGAISNLVFTDSWWYISDSFLIALATAPISLRKWVEYPQGTFTPVLYSGAQTYVLSTSARNLSSDVVAVTIPAGATWWEHTMNVTGAAVSIPTQELPAQAATLGLADTRYAATDINTPAHQTTGSASINFFGATIITATVAAANVKTIFAVGDSLTWGQGDVTSTDSFGGSGYVQRLANAKGYSCATFGKKGMSASDMAAMITSASPTLGGYLSIMLPACTHALNEFGGNDLRLNRTQTQLLANYQTIYGAMTGKTVCQATIIPRATSTDAYATTTNQAPQTDGNWAALSSVNAAIRAVPSGVSVIVESADAAMSARDSGVWRIPGGVPTLDGTHPTSFMAAYMAANIPLAL